MSVFTKSPFAAAAQSSPAQASPAQASPAQASPARPLVTPALVAALLAISSLTPAGWAAPGPADPPATRAVEEDFDHTHARWTAVLAQHVHGDRFDYAALRLDRTPLDDYIIQLRVVGADQLAGWTREQRYAFWINAYNAHVVQLVMDNYPLESIKDLGGLFSPVWKKRFIKLKALHPGGSGKELSLNDIEHEILRPRFKDARVHAAINCASIGCPPLRSEAFVAERLDEQLDGQVRQWLADSNRNQYEPQEATLRVSEIFDWFEEDFERDAGSVRKWIARYAPPEEVEWLRATKQVRVKYLNYSWKLNEVARR